MIMIEAIFGDCLTVVRLFDQSSPSSVTQPSDHD